MNNVNHRPTDTNAIMSNEIDKAGRGESSFFDAALMLHSKVVARMMAETSPMAKQAAIELLECKIRIDMWRMINEANE